jgi:Na+/melibiose symporter-like transporter
MPEAGGWNGSPGDLIVSLVPVALWAVALLSAAIAVALGPRPISFGSVVDRLLRYMLIFPVGVQGLWAFVCHVFIPEQAAASIGWEPSPFQFEVGVADLGIGLAGLYAAFQSFQARAAVAVMAACFLGGAAVGHMMDIALGDNLTPGNAGPILYTDILTPIAMLVLLLVSPRQKQARAAAEASLAERIETAIEASPRPRAAEASPRIEDELERARKGMREQLNAGPMPEGLPPAERPLRDRLGKPQRRKAAPDRSKI